MCFFVIKWVCERLYYLYCNVMLCNREATNYCKRDVMSQMWHLSHFHVLRNLLLVTSVMSRHECDKCGCAFAYRYANAQPPLPTCQVTRRDMRDVMSPRRHFRKMSPEWHNVTLVTSCDQANSPHLAFPRVKPNKAEWPCTRLSIVRLTSENLPIQRYILPQNAQKTCLWASRIITNVLMWTHPCEQ